MLGLLILITGILLLLRNMGYVSAEMWNTLWPIIVIAVGLKMMMKHKKYGHHCCKEK